VILSLLVVLLIVLVCAITLQIPLIRRTKHIEAQNIEIHTLVNQSHTDLLNYQAALLRALNSAGIEIPEDQSAGS
jgi:Na+-transporting NADH:ubiquinone oxidoreductase subunit NqrF